MQSGVTAPVETYLRYKRATVIPFSFKFWLATCVFAHQKMRGAFAKAFFTQKRFACSSNAVHKQATSFGHVLFRQTTSVVLSRAGEILPGAN